MWLYMMAEFTWCLLFTVYMETLKRLKMLPVVGSINLETPHVTTTTYSSTDQRKKTEHNGNGMCENGELRLDRR